MKKYQWREWTKEDWNEALFKHFFYDFDGEDRPVHRISVTGDQLSQVVSEPEVNAEEVQEAFLASLRTPSNIEFNHRLSRYETDPQVGWKGTGLPPFFVELAFTCLVASPPDGEIRVEGDFRKRLALLMEHDLFSGGYPLENLGQLWKAYSRWLDTMRAAGKSYRRLELPPKDHRVRIGYSINLAFPLRKDLEKLTKALSEGVFASDPPIPTVFALVGKKINTFSKSFQRAYEEFRDAYRTRKVDLDQYPFWGAVHEAIASLENTGDIADKEVGTLKLVMEPSGEVVLLSDSSKVQSKGQFSFFEVDTPYDEFRYVFCFGNDLEKGVENATYRILRGAYREFLSGKGWPLIHIAIVQGVLLFARTEQMSWELMFTLQEEKYYRALIKDDLARTLLSIFPEKHRPNSKMSRYSGWTEIERFPAECLTSLRYESQNPLAGIRCLQPTVRRPKLTFIGGCRLEGGYLGIPECLPSIHAPFSTKVEVVSMESDGRTAKILLEKHESNPAQFVFPGDYKYHLKGRFRFVGSREGRVIVKKEIVFQPDIVVNTYAQPTDTAAWLVEGGGPDVITYSEMYRSKKLAGNLLEKSETDEEKGKISPFEPNAHSIPKTGPQNWQRLSKQISPCFDTDEALKQFSDAIRLMEICGGLAMRRKGIREGEFLGYVRATQNVDKHQAWDVMRAWVEVGYLNRLMYRKWRRTEYFPNLPQLVLEQDGSQVRAAMYGLATSVLRNRVDIDLLEKGASRIETSSFSEWVPPIPMWVAPDSSVFEDVARRLLLNNPVWGHPVTGDSLWSFEEIISHKDHPPRFHEYWGCWDFNTGGFVREKELSGQNIEISMYIHTQRTPFYEVLSGGERVWWSISRNWALLLAYDLLGIPCFALSGSNQIVRIVKGQVYLPLPVGRYLASSCPVTSGPVCYPSGTYCYHFPNSVERSHFLRLFWGDVALPMEELRRWGRWMLALSRRNLSTSSNRTIPLPSQIKSELEQFPEVPEFFELSRIRFDPSLLPRLREGLSRFSKAKED